MMVLLPQVISLSPDIQVLYIIAGLLVLLSHVEQVGLVVDHVLDGLVGEYAIVQGVVAHPLKNKGICSCAEGSTARHTGGIASRGIPTVEHHGKEPG